MSRFNRFFKDPTISRVVVVLAAAICAALVFFIFSAIGIPLKLLTTLETVDIARGGTSVKTAYNPLALVLFASLIGIAVALIGRLVEDLGARGAHAGGARAEIIEDASDSLSSEMSKVLGVIRGHLTSSETYAKSLSGAQQRLSALREPEQVRVVVKLLVAENERMRRDTEDLKDKLGQSQAHIDALRANLTQAMEQGLKDPLTGVGNRRAFEAAIERAYINASEGKRPMSLVMCDIDNFKKVNDTFGHAVGDEVLKAFARVLEDSVREGDTVARYGGEEFAVILPGAPQEGAVKLAERIRTQFEQKRMTLRSTNQTLGTLTASFGVAQLRPREEQGSLVERADQKLYEAKRGGRNRVAAFDVP